MYAHTLKLPANTPHIVVDPLNDFTDGAFVDCYGRDDTEPVRTLVRDLDAMTAAWQQKARLILCKSKYIYDQFGVPGLERLCTTDAGRTSAIPEERFSSTICKFDNSLLSAEIDLEELLGDSEFFGVEGLTTTSCVIRTIEDCRERFRGRTIVVPASAVGVRASRTNDGLRILQQLADPAEKQVLVVPGWRSIQHAD